MGEEPRAYKVTKLTEAININGNWNKPAWKKIKPLVINKHMGEKPAHRPKVQAKLGLQPFCPYYNTKNPLKKL